jgi:hypothetical protein
VSHDRALIFVLLFADIDQLRYNYKAISMSPNFIHYTRATTDSSYAAEFASYHPAHHQIKRLCWNQYDLVLVLGEQRLVGGFAGLKGPRERELGVNALDTMGGVQVLDKGDLVAGCGALTRDDGGVGEEEFPDLVCQQCPGSRWVIKLTLYHLLPYFAKTFSLLAIQFLYHLQRVAE